MNALTATPSLTAVAVACALVYVATAARFLWYRPNGARHRRILSLVACLLIAALFCRAGQILLLRDPAGLPELVIAALVCAAAWRVRGNLATLIRSCPDA
ncbi:Protein of uncharacterised function (DUF754) [Achromobacter xylosoxidans]|uniref:phage holin family protein n=2 Tax=Alcaligenes xylosoxydans xylosoxydans TaxID=85698 RepID=UPI0006C0B94B|nr:phage holin family protein [Achromobacter xylosoxidans]MCH1990807.1 phage holin family protein [Achromobacter xylosoxidans]MCH1995293.1 phage holin family protein [Achromobacter xylosoxidans]CUI71570.1 Protein of uncharacterised function (DUF754) [Achromobacter xylosoxidans]